MVMYQRYLRKRRVTGAQLYKLRGLMERFGVTCDQLELAINNGSAEAFVRGLTVTGIAVKQFRLTLHFDNWEKALREGAPDTIDGTKLWMPDRCDDGEIYIVLLGYEHPEDPVGHLKNRRFGLEAITRWVSSDSAEIFTPCGPWEVLAFTKDCQDFPKRILRERFACVIAPLMLPQAPGFFSVYMDNYTRTAFMSPYEKVGDRHDWFMFRVQRPPV